MLKQIQQRIQKALSRNRVVRRVALARRNKTGIVRIQCTVDTMNRVRLSGRASKEDVLYGPLSVDGVRETLAWLIRHKEQDAISDIPK